MLVLLIVLLTPCSPRRGLACTCLQRPEPHTIAEARAALASTDAVFAGRVLRTTLRRDSSSIVSADGDSTWFRYATVVATLAVRQVWKGEVPDTVQVETASQTTMCGADLRAGENYVIDADRIGRSIFATSKCGWTRPLSQAGELEALLRRVAAMPSLAAQGRGAPWRLWGAAGLGSAGGGNEEGVAAVGQVVFQKAPHHVAIRAVGILDPFDPGTCGMGDIGVLYGRMTTGRVGHAAVAAGVAATDAPGCDVGPGTSQWTVGVPIIAELALRPMRLVGFGLQGFANANSRAHFGGVAIFVQLGWLPR
jgi:hypothetical protein